MKSCSLKTIAALAIIIIIILSQSLAFAQDQAYPTLKLSIKEATAKALANTHKIIELEQAYNSMFNSYKDIERASIMVQQQLDDMVSYEKLFKKRQLGGSLDELEARQLLTFTAMFGSVPPQLNPEEKFKKYIKNRDFPILEMQASLQNLHTNKELIKASITSGVWKLFDNILKLQESLALQKQMYDISLKQDAQLQEKFKRGLVAEADSYISKIELQKQKLNLLKLERTLDNLEISFKQQIGVPLTQEISLVPIGGLTLAGSPEKSSVYLDKALSNRYEVVTTKMNMQVKQRELDIMKEYITNAESPDRIDAQAALEDKVIAYKDAVMKITDEINYAWQDVATKLADVNTAAKKKTNAEGQLNKVKMMYDRGLVNSSMLWNAQLGLSQAQVGYSAAVRTYNGALESLKEACGVGPAYTTSTGGI